MPGEEGDDDYREPFDRGAHIAGPRACTCACWCAWLIAASDLHHLVPRCPTLLARPLACGGISRPADPLSGYLWRRAQLLTERSGWQPRRPRNLAHLRPVHLSGRHG